ncbi:MAG: ComEA family DNA-binding protein [Gemmatimonadales bacterium]
MITPRERRALGALVAVALLGHAVRIFVLSPATPPGALVLGPGLVPADPALHLAQSARLARPIAEGEWVDLNRATAAEIARLPRVGPRLAKALVRTRDSTGGFASLAEVDQVPGVGPALLAAIGSRVRLGDTDQVRRRRPDRRGLAVERRPPEPPNVVVRRGGDPAPRPVSRPGPIRLNSATQRELERLPGIGPTRAKAIVAYRQSNGPFASVSDLEKVPGLSPRLVRQLAPQVAVP